MRTHARHQAELSYPDPSALTETVTPVEAFFVRDHLEHRPRTDDPGAWTVEIRGLVEEPRSVTVAEFAVMEQHEIACVLECAGNGNLRRDMLSAIGNGVFAGARLRDVLALAGAKPGARFVHLRGADRGEDPDRPGIDGEYVRSLELGKAAHEDTLLALRMNGEPLQPQHGAPVRAVVPGHYGMDSVKWLAAVEVAADMDDGFYQQHRYREVLGPDDRRTGRFVRGPRIKSLITAPADGEAVAAGPCRVSGFAWGSEGVRRVLVSCDDGASWVEAESERPLSVYAWVPWSVTFPLAPGAEHVLVARAEDARGDVQPLGPVEGRTYEANWVHRARIRTSDGAGPGHAA